MRRLLPVLVLAAGLAGGCRGSGGYQASFAFPSAAGVVKGSVVKIGGFKVGTVTALEARDKQALIKVSVDAKHAPLRSGTTARIGYLGLLGEKVVEVTPGPKDATPLPDGAIITGNTPRVDIDDVLLSLDPDTRAALIQLLPRLDGALANHEADLNATLEAAGPAVDALSAVLTDLGQDGPALRRLLTSTRALVSHLNDRRESVRATLGGLETNLTATAARQEALRRGIAELPGTLAAADAALGQVPGASQAAVPLLRDLQPSVAALPGVAADLRPLLDDLTPTLQELRPALPALSGVLAEAPALLDRAQRVVPPLTTAVAALLPAIDFLRPYTPELAGLLANLGSASAGYDANGHYTRILLRVGLSSTGVPDPLSRQQRHRQPGSLEGPAATGAATDAYGSPVP